TACEENKMIKTLKQPRCATATVLGLALTSTNLLAEMSDQPTSPLTGEATRHIAIAHDFVRAEHAEQIHLYLNTKTELDENGRLDRFNDRGDVTWKNRVADAHNDGTIAWGRWALGFIGGNGDHADFEITGGEGARNSLYYAVGEPVDEGDLSDAAAAALTATFSLLGGGVAPSAGEGGGASITYINAADLKANFGTGRVDVNLDVTVPSGNYIVAMKGLKLNGDGFALDAETVAESTGTLCVAGCTATLVGFFAGSDLARAAIAYNIVNNALSRDINGIVTFSRD
ncbi:MAG: hypothetical protein J4A00_11175, partial [Gammaproteobacteria bacterium]|nr:hypothetical protein [Gammaproteobacteria bacterium]